MARRKGRTCEREGEREERWVRGKEGEREEGREGRAKVSAQDEGRPVVHRPELRPVRQGPLDAPLRQQAQKREGEGEGEIAREKERRRKPKIASLGQHSSSPFSVALEHATVANSRLVIHAPCKHHIGCSPQQLAFLCEMLPRPVHVLKAAQGGTPVAETSSEPGKWVPGKLVTWKSALRAKMTTAARMRP